MTQSDDKKILEEAGFSRRLEPGARPAVLVVDLTTGFTDPECPVGSDLAAEVEATASLVELAHERGLPVVFTAIRFRDDLSDGGVWLEKAPGLGVLTESSGYDEIDPGLPRQEGDPVIVKQGASAFFGTPLTTLLTSRGVDALVVCGATTSGCVRATVVDALQSGFRCIVPRQCVGDRAPRAHEANLADIDAKYGEVVDLEQARAYLSDPAGGLR